MLSLALSTQLSIREAFFFSTANKSKDRSRQTFPCKNSGICSLSCLKMKPMGWYTSSVIRVLPGAETNAEH